MTTPAWPQVYPGVVKSNHLERTTFYGKDVNEERRNFRNMVRMLPIAQTPQQVRGRARAHSLDWAAAQGRRALHGRLHVQFHTHTHGVHTCRLAQHRRAHMHAHTHLHPYVHAHAHMHNRWPTASTTAPPRSRMTRLWGCPLPLQQLPTSSQAARSTPLQARFHSCR